MGLYLREWSRGTIWSNCLNIARKMDTLFLVRSLSLLQSCICLKLSSAFNCTSTSTINAVLQAARDINSPVIIQVNYVKWKIPTQKVWHSKKIICQFSNGGAAFLAGKGIKNTGEFGCKNIFYIVFARSPHLWCFRRESCNFGRYCWSPAC